MRPAVKPTVGAGVISLVGVGPGGFDALTVASLKALREASTVFVDDGVDSRIAEHVPDGVTLHFGAPRATPSALLEAAEAGARVVRVCHGDPMTSGRIEHELAQLVGRGVWIEVWPALGAATAIAAFAGTPLFRDTDLSPSFAVVRVHHHLELHDWQKLAMATDTLVIDTLFGLVPEVARTLSFHGRPDDTSALVALDLGKPEQRVVQGSLVELTRSDLGGDDANRGAFVVVGDVTRLTRDFAWFEQRPLAKKKIFLPRAAEQAQAFAERLRRDGADPVIAPTIRIVDPADPEPLETALAKLPGGYDAIVFTSANGVERTWRALTRLGKDARAFGGCVVACIGPATAAVLASHGVVADIVAEVHTGEGLAAALAERVMGKRVLVPRAKVARRALIDELERVATQVDVVTAYETVGPDDVGRERIDAALRQGIDAACFTSPSTIDRLFDLLGQDAVRSRLADVVIASIGPVTTRAIEEHGLSVDVEASPHTTDALADALSRHFSADSEEIDRRDQRER